LTPEEAGRHFPEVVPVAAEALGAGLIHQTWRMGGFVIQRCNTDVFTDIDAVMRNVTAVLPHVAPELRAVPAEGGRSVWRDPAGDVWRVLPFLADTVPAGPPPMIDVSQAFELGHGLASFHLAAGAVAPEELEVTLEGLHAPAARLVALDRVAGRDAFGRVAAAQRELAAVDEARSLADLAISPPSVPQRVAHFDAKVDNFLLDRRTGKVRALIDLDTVMPGSILWDVGDLIRTATATAAEDEPAAMAFAGERFVAAMEGYRSTASFLTEAEIERLTVAPLVVTFEQAVRFLTDHLDGDRYYRISRPGHNLDRARAQLALLRSMRAPGSAMISAS
jgi:N-acetylhexosamine 1-kinase